MIIFISLQNMVEYATSCGKHIYVCIYMSLGLLGLCLEQIGCVQKQRDIAIKVSGFFKYFFHFKSTMNCEKHSE